MEQFSAGPINKAVPSFTSSFDKSTWTVTEDILSIYFYSKKCSHSQRFVCTVLNSWDNFW